jgi:hypothetical protein
MHVTSTIGKLHAFPLGCGPRTASTGWRRSGARPGPQPRRTARLRAPESALQPDEAHRTTRHREVHQLDRSAILHMGDHSAPGTAPDRRDQFDREHRPRRFGNGLGHLSQKRRLMAGGGRRRVRLRPPPLRFGRGGLGAACVPRRGRHVGRSVPHPQCQSINPASSTRRM